MKFSLAYQREGVDVGTRREGTQLAFMNRESQQRRGGHVSTIRIPMNSEILFPEERRTQEKTDAGLRKKLMRASRVDAYVEFTIVKLVEANLKRTSPNISVGSRFAALGIWVQAAAIDQRAG